MQSATNKAIANKYIYKPASRVKFVFMWIFFACCRMPHAAAAIHSLANWKIIKQWATNRARSDKSRFRCALPFILSDRAKPCALCKTHTHTTRAPKWVWLYFNWLPKRTPILNRIMATLRTKLYVDVEWDILAGNLCSEWRFSLSVGHKSSMISNHKFYELPRARVSRLLLYLWHHHHANSHNDARGEWSASLQLVFFLCCIFIGLLTNHS